MPRGSKSMWHCHYALWSRNSSEPMFREKRIDRRGPEPSAAREQLMTIAVRHRVRHDKLRDVGALAEGAIPRDRPLRTPEAIVLGVEPQPGYTVGLSKAAH